MHGHRASRLVEVVGQADIKPAVVGTVEAKREVAAVEHVQRIHAQSTLFGEKAPSDMCVPLPFAQTHKPRCQEPGNGAWFERLSAFRPAHSGPYEGSLLRVRLTALKIPIPRKIKPPMPI